MNWYKKAQEDQDQEEYKDGTLEEDLPKKNKAGDCYMVSAKYLENEYFKGNKNLVLVHGEVEGQGAIRGLRYGHAWVENGDMVIDKSNGKNLEIPKVIYYSIGNIKPNEVFKYNYEQMLKKTLESGHWGPWDLKTRL